MLSQVLTQERKSAQSSFDDFERKDLKIRDDLTHETSKQKKLASKITKVRHHARASPMHLISSCSLLFSDQRAAGRGKGQGRRLSERADQVGGRSQEDGGGAGGATTAAGQSLRGSEGVFAQLVPAVI